MEVVPRRKWSKASKVSISLGGTSEAASGSKSMTGRSALMGPRPNRIVKVGVVGGNFGRMFFWHLHPNSRVTAVCDVRGDRLQTMAETYDCRDTYRDFLTFLREGDMDAVAAFVSPPLNTWMSIQAMKAGKHVISAIPAGLSIEECEQLLETVEKTGMKYMMAETSYFSPETTFCREAAREGKFGTIFYSEGEYQGGPSASVKRIMRDEKGLPTWRYGFPPMHYPTHATGITVSVTGERLVEVSCVGWGDNQETVQTNPYRNPFWNQTAFFKTSGGHCCRISLHFNIAQRGAERGSLYGTKMSYIMRRPEGTDNTLFRVLETGRTVVGEDGYPRVENLETISPHQPSYWDRLPEPLRPPSGEIPRAERPRWAHRGSHPYLTHEFVSALLEDRHPAINVYEALAYTVPGLIAHQSALRGGETLKVPDYGRVKS